MPLKSSAGLGFGFLNLLYLEIIQERLSREHDLITTARKRGEEVTTRHPPAF